MKRLLLFLLLLPSLALAARPRIAWYTSGNLDGASFPMDTSAAADRLRIVDTVMKYDIIMGIGQRAAKWIRDYYPDTPIILTYYRTAVELYDYDGSGIDSTYPEATSIYDKFTDQQLSPWSAMLTFRLGDTVEAYVGSLETGPNDTSNVRFDGFSRMVRPKVYVDRRCIRTPGLYHQDSGTGTFTDFTEIGYKNTASITFGNEDTLYLGDIMPFCSLRVDLSTAATLTGDDSLIVQYIDTAGDWETAPAAMKDSIEALFTSGTAEIVKYFGTPPPLAGADKWGWTTVNSQPVNLNWIRMYWSQQPDVAPVITMLRRDSYAIWKSGGTGAVDTVYQNGWKSTLDTDNDGWRDSVPQTATDSNSFANCRDHATIYATAKAYGTRFTGIINPTDTTAMKVLAGAIFNDSSYTDGLCFDQTAFLAIPEGPTEWSPGWDWAEADECNEYYNVGDTVLGFQWKHDLMAEYFAVLYDTIAAHSDRPYIGGTTSQYVGGTETIDGRLWSPGYMRGIDWNHPDRPSTDSAEWWGGLRMFFVEYAGGAAFEGTMSLSNDYDRVVDMYYEFMCSRQTLLLMWNVGYSSSDTTIRFCSPLHRDLYSNYSLAHYWLIRPGGLDDTLLYYGRYAGVQGATLNCRGYVTGESEEAWYTKALEKNLGEPVDSLDLSLDYVTDSTWADSLFKEWDYTGSSYIMSRKYVGGTDTNLVLFRVTEGTSYDHIDDFDKADSSVTGLDTFALDKNYWRLYPDGNWASPLHPGIKAANDSVALFPADGALLVVDTLFADTAGGTAAIAHQIKGVGTIRGVGKISEVIENGRHEETRLAVALAPAAGAVSRNDTLSWNR